MIRVLNTEYTTYEQDIRELLNAFFPGEPFAGEETEKALFCVDVDRIAGALPLTGSRFEDKSLIKKAVYETVSRETGKNLPWGTLTGIKPVKLADRLMKEGMPPEEITHAIQKRYLVSDEKTRLMLSIAEKECELEKQFPADGYSIYAGIPFCPTRCLYCSFTSNPLSVAGSRTGEYVEALKKEFAAYRELSERMTGKKKLHPSTLYIGGGTPTALSAPELSDLLTFIDDVVDRESLLEYTVESGRPDSITAEKLRVLSDHGVQRISINPQTMNQKTLDIIGRRHTVEQTLEAFSLARSMGFENINMDLIMGLPGETIRDVEHTLSEIEKLRPESLTVHALSVKRAARLSTEHDPWKDYERAEGAEAEKMTALGYECALRMNMHPYYLYRQKNMAGNQENIGYSLSGKESLYNMIMMEEKQAVIGFGAGSTSKPGFGRKERLENIKDLSQYLSRIDELIEKRNIFFSDTRLF